jgi:Spy/CpxP family protein refolding chaperone
MGPQMQGPGRVGQGQAMGMGMRGRMGMAMRERMAARNLTLGQLARNPQFRERIGLTPEQVSKIQAQESIFAKARIRNQAELQVKRMELRELMQEEKPDRALIEKKMREVTEAEFAQRKAAVDHQLTMRDLITPEQKQKLQEVRQEMRTRHMQAGQGRGMGPGMGLGRGPQGPQPPQPPAPPKPPDDKPNF